MSGLLSFKKVIRVEFPDDSVHDVVPQRQTRANSSQFDERAAELEAKKDAGEIDAYEYCYQMTLFRIKDPTEELKAAIGLLDPGELVKLQRRIMQELGFSVGDDDVPLDTQEHHTEKKS